MAGIATPGRRAAGAGSATRRARAAHSWQRGIALTALILPVAPVAVLLKEGAPPFGPVVPLLVLAVPTVLRGNRAWFRTSCAVLAVVVAGWSLLVAPEGVWFLLPVSLLLLCAGLADPRAHPAVAGVSTFLAVAVGVVPGLVAIGAALTLVGR
ncbi:hypothetical protein [Streptomyces sp. NBC_01264]|uniref:hypothetical protein n=1 Tax=Streptomyces sp. NBC_01264 TaxID=2903804 RepID=UPI00224C9D8D|nr:hypothetical protein [Streptomyces sp. NBC_01264]MCX4777264.1 hypothetical protein [Streptomyces sp. NBC_01264]